MKQTGMAAPTIRPWRTPRVMMMISITSRVAVIRPDSRMVRVWSMNSLSSKV